LKGGSIHTLGNNVFSNNAANAACPFGAGLVLAKGVTFGSKPPLVESATGNQFVANEIGIDVLSLDPASDFGFASQGGNSFHCNSTATGAAGYDLKMETTDTASFHFHGNAWDHYPTPTDTATAGANGTDIYRAAGAATVETDDAIGNDEVCPAGHVP
jgi:hypothetical protein